MLLRLGLLVLSLGITIVAFSPPATAAAKCVPFSEAQKHIGAITCVSGTVVRVEQGNGGVHFFDFCEDYRVCPFTVVVFPSDLKQVGDVRQLKGRQIEIDGEVKSYDGRAEIVLQRLSQLRGDAAKIPPVPKQYDVERRGNYSAGTFRAPRKAKGSTTKKSKPPATVIWDDPSEMGTKE
jgi:hypothetical protein